MAIEKKEIEYAKEMDDLGHALVELVRDIKAKKDIAQIAGENIPTIMDALAGIDKVDDELKANRTVAIQTIGRHLGGLVDAVLPQDA